MAGDKDIQTQDQTHKVQVSCAVVSGYLDYRIRRISAQSFCVQITLQLEESNSFSYKVHKSVERIS